MDRRIRIEQKSVTRDPNYGAEVVSWVTLASVWAEVTDVGLQSGESTAQQVRVLTGQTKVCIRYRSDIKSDMRIIIIYRSRTLQIVSVNEVGRRDEIEMMCEEYTSG